MAQCSFHSAAFSLPHPRPRIPKISSIVSPQFDSSIPARADLTSPAFITRPEVETPVTFNGGVFAVSDLHTEYPENMCWVKSLSPNKHGKNVLIVAGDVAETTDNFLLTMSILKDRFEHVFFVPGNHDLWLRRDKIDYLCSLDKLDKLLEACQKLGVETKPSIVDGLGIVPLYSWYHESFDEERDITEYRIPSLEMVINFLSPSM